MARPHKVLQDEQLETGRQVITCSLCGKCSDHNKTGHPKKVITNYSYGPAKYVRQNLENILQVYNQGFGSKVLQRFDMAPHSCEDWTAYKEPLDSFCQCPGKWTLP
jgi:hypothetical protein